ncbi:ArsR/SmtB family transcription factor [Thiomicrorhabdus arctica]|jgi:ArsR family transcriptional regulator|uniref:ArsR/SmtB family transcription factor n=1 Tax=Thiomicrorhabdus arctica TaxID=131540 RepID=UPI00036ACC6B|nr:metalloregulator ArsR/SmtB family transcription factor [Thiomicrorhabdus arctica]
MDSCESNLKLCLFEQLAQIGKSLGHANRLLILDVLAQGSCQVEVLSFKLGLSVANVSKHLQHLKQAGLVVNEVQGTQRIYQLSDEAIVPLIQILRQIAENQMAEVANLLNQKLLPRAPLMPFNPKELKQAVQEKKVTLLDVRPSDEYLAGHIDGAINLPIESLDHPTTQALAFAQLSQQKPIVVYCRGPYCLWSYEAVEKLQANGHMASRMPEGYPEWAMQQS